MYTFPKMYYFTSHPVEVGGGSGVHPYKHALITLVWQAYPEIVVISYASNLG